MVADLNSDAINDSISTDSDAISTKPSAYLLGAETRPLNTILICHVMSCHVICHASWEEHVYGQGS